jgi:uncharacterized Zn-binding protein involved in type VI secretion
MPAVARMSSADSVFSPHGAGKKCRFPTTQSTQAGSSRVFSMGKGVVRLDDAMITHNDVNCIAHTPTLSSSSTRVFVEGKGIGRIGDSYEGHPIISGSPRVFSN